MKTFEYLADWQLAQLVLIPLLSGLLVASLCAVLSVLVVLKRLSFVGQGVSHSAFGGIGLAAMAAVLLSAGFFGVGAGRVLGPLLEQGAVGEFLIVVLFCVASALGMARVGGRVVGGVRRSSVPGSGGGVAGGVAGGGGGAGGRAVRVDTGIGLYLVASMAAGALLVQASGAIARSRGLPGGTRSWESILFGSIVTASWSDVLVALVVLVLALGTLWAFRRAILFWTFDEPSAMAFGVPTAQAQTVLMILLAVATVTAMKLCGVVLATALLVLPGAVALRLCVSLRQVLALALGVGTLAVALGLLVSIETDAQTGPCIVLVLCGLFGLAGVLQRGVPSVFGKAP